MYIQNKNSKKWENKLELLDKQFYNKIREDIKKVIFYSNTINGAIYHVSSDKNKIYNATNIAKLFFTPEKDINYNFSSYQLVDFIVNVNYDISNINTLIDNVSLLDGNTLLLNNQLNTSEFGVYTYQNEILTKQIDIKNIIFIKNGNEKDTYWEYNNTRYNKTEFYLIKNKINYLNINENNYYDIVIDNGINSVLNNITPKKLYIGDNGLIIVDDNGIKNILYNTFKYRYNSIVLLNDCYIAVGELGSVIKINRHTLDITKFDLNSNINFNKIQVNQYNTNDVVIIGDNNTIFFSIDNGKTFTQMFIDIDQFANIYDISFKNNTTFQLICSLGILVNINYTKRLNIFTYTNNIKYKSDINKNNQIIKSIYNTFNAPITLNTIRFNNSIMDIPRTIGDSDFTINFWIQLFTPNNNVKYIMSRGVELQSQPFTDLSFYYGFNIYVLNNIIYFQFGDLINSPLTIDTKNAITDSRYHNVTITRNKGVFKIYFDDILKDSISSTYTGGLNSNYKGNVIRIGGKLETKYDGSYTTNVVDGADFKIQNLRLFNSGLSLIDILKYKNAYTELPTLVAHYSFIKTKGYIIGNDISKRNDAIYIDNLINVNDVYNCDLYITQNKLIMLSNEFYNTTNTIVYNFNLDKNKYIKVFVYNNNIYVLNNDLLYITVFDLNINVFNDISDIKINMLISKVGAYKNYKLDNDVIYLLGYNDVTTFNMLNQLENGTLSTITLNADKTYTDKIKFNGYKSIKISDNLSAPYYEYDDLDYCVIFNNTTQSQSYIDTYISDYYDMPLIYSKQYAVEVHVSEMYNATLYISLDNINFSKIKSHGYYNILMAVGISSKIYIKAIPIINTNKVYVKIKNILISDKLTYEYDRLDVTTFRIKNLKNLKISDSNTYYKYYFNQFTELNFNSYKNSIRKYLNVKSLMINNTEVLNLSSYYNNGFPKILFTGSATTMSCNNTNCVINPLGSNYDRFVDSMGFTKDINGLYVDNNTNILTYLDINTDISTINNGVLNINSPFYIKSINNDSFKLTMESVCVTMSNTVGNLYHTYSGSVNTLDLIKLNVDTLNNISVASTTHSNLIIATNSNNGIINLLCTIDGKPLVENTSYRIDLQFLNPLTSSIGIYLGTISNYGITLSATTSTFIGLNIKKYDNTDVYISGVTYSNIKIKTSTNTSFQLQNVFLSSVTSDIYEIDFDKDNATYSYLKNGNQIDGFLNRNGSFINLPISDISTYSSTYTNLVNNYIDYKENRFLFMDYNIGSKLSFFNKNLEYNIPNTIKFSYEASVNSLNITNIPNEYNWLDYYKDDIKTPPYLDNNDYGIVFSSNFRKTSSFNYLSINANKITTTFSNIGYIMPNFATNSTSLTVLSITPSNSNFDVYWYKNNMAIKATYSFTFQVGDVVLIEHDILTSGILATVVYSNVYTVSGNDYVYAYLSNNLNESIINNMKSSGTLKLTNLNLYTSNNELIANFNKHYISKGYNMKSDNQYVYITPLINNNTVYYNMQSRIEILENSIITYDSIYNNSFINFKYTPNYSIKNILLELNDISNNPIFSNHYTFTEMSTGYNLLIDNANINISDYEILFDISHIILYENYFKYTFIDITIYNVGNSIVNTQSKLLILDKYINNGKYILKLHKKISLPNDAHHIDILSRNKLNDISSDLNELNNIQPNININSIGRSDFKSTLPFKINTESYYKILSNDINIKKEITSICYTDNNNVLSMSILKNDKKISYAVNSIDSFVTQSQYCSYSYAKYGFTTSVVSTYSNILYNNNIYIPSIGNILGLIDSASNTFYINTPYNISDEYLLTFDITNIQNSYAIITTGTMSTTYSTTGVKSMLVRNATFSKIEVFMTSSINIFVASHFKIGNSDCILPMTYSKININGIYSYGSDSLVNLQINSTYSGYYNGYNIVKSVINNNELVIYKEYKNDIHTGSITVFDFDPYLDFVPTDISKIGSDLKTDIYTKIDESKLSLNDYLELSTIDINKKKYRLVDGLTIYDIYSKYKWLIEAEIEDAVIGEDKNGLIWYSGKWYYGRWFGYAWYSGEWYNGEWYSGTMYSKDVNIVGDIITINNNLANKTIWYDGNVHDGELYNITWLNGNFYKGSINNVYWISGNFHNGNMINSYFNGGTFINGTFINGDISQIYDDVNWLNGDFKSGNFKNGTFHNGIIQEFKGGKTYFGSDTSNDRKASIIAGNILAGNIGNVNDDNTTINSAYISYANITNTTIKNSDLKNGDITNSILEDIDVVAINLSNLDQYIVVKGIYNFNIGYVLYIMDSNNNYLQIKVKDYLKTINNDYTLIPIITTNYNINQGFVSNIIGVDNILYNVLNYRLVSYISNVNWIGGIFNNGIFDGSYFKGLFKKGLFKSGVIG